MMRLDRLIAESGVLSRSQAGKAVREGRVTVNGIIVKRPEQKVMENSDVISLDGAVLGYQAKHYYLMDKPTGVITAARDPKQKTVLELFPQEVQKQGVFPVGRLDKDTSGLLLFTDDGDFAHRVISPKSGVWKTYEAQVEGELSSADVQMFADGIRLKDGTLCLPAKLQLLGPGRCLVTVQEGKYHQVRRMLAAAGKPVKTLRRLSVGGLRLDDGSVPGTWRPLREDEVSLVLCGSDG
ncbi:MAG: rRNA pseudouridine synthase [Oscillospiraceae bacterium]|nr:rRNA pseudouridine synthase [Oscillospiraceae bacterium]